MTWLTKAGQFLSTLPMAAAEVYKIGFKTIFSIIPGIGTLTKKTSGTAGTSQDGLSNAMFDLANVLTPPAAMTNSLMNTALMSWVKKNWFFGLLLGLAIWMLIRTFKNKKYRR